MQECVFFDAEQIMMEDISIVAPTGMQSCHDVFSFYNVALLFPDYFGWNWDAFHDCIHDLSWIEGTTIHIVHPDIPLINDPRGRVNLLCDLHETKFYSRTRGKLVVHFMASDKRRVQDLLFNHYRTQECCGSNRYLEYYRSRKRWKDDAEVALRIIDKGLAISYSELGLLDESELNENGISSYECFE